MQDSLLSLNRLRQEIDLEKSRHKRSDPSQDKDFEACIRTKNNAWVVAKVTRGKELYMALEKGGETLLYASTAVEKFSNRYPFALYFANSNFTFWIVFIISQSNICLFTLLIYSSL
jgi:hypothetical protein